MTTPDFLPTLSAGSHDAEHGEACVMEYVSLLAHEARTTNDLLRDSDRSRLVPLIGRLFGTTDDSPGLRARLRITQARQVITLIEPAARARALAAVERAESWIGRDGGTDEDVRDAFAEAMGAPISTGDLDPEHVEFHTAMSRMFPFALSPDLEAAEAYALTALVIAHRTAAGECRADCGNGPARARRMVKDLGALIDTYDEVTGRIAVEVTPDEVRELSDAIG